MTISFFETLVDLVSPQMVSRLSTQLGECEGAVQHGLELSSAVLMSALAAKAMQPNFLATVVGLVAPPVKAGRIGNLRTLPKPITERAEAFLSLTVGTEQPAAISIITRKARLLRVPSAMKLLEASVAIIMRVLGQRVQKENLAPAMLGSLLRAEAPAWQVLLRSELEPSGDVESMAWRRRSETPAPEPEPGARSFWPLATMVAVLVFSAFWLSQQTVGHADAGAPKPPVSRGWGMLGELEQVKLRNGVVLSVPSLGVEKRLINYLTSHPTDSASFDFDRVVFNTNQATLQPVSQAQLRNIAVVLSAYPEVRLQIGGDTDDAGKPARSVAISADRARNVAGELVKAGVDPARLTLERYGEEDGELVRSRLLFMRIAAR